MADDIIDAIAKVSLSFRGAGLKPPAAILLADHREGIKLIMSLHQRASLTVERGADRIGKPIEAPDGSVWMEIEIYGLKVRWPAERIAYPDGHSAWI